MTDLIERLKAATEGSAELDRAIGEVTGRGYFEQPCLGAYCYTRSIDTAVMLVPEGLEWEVSFTRVPHFPPGEAIIHIKPFWGASDHDRDARIVGDAATPALALCIVALMARETA